MLQLGHAVLALLTPQALLVEEAAEGAGGVWVHVPGLVIMYYRDFQQAQHTQCCIVASTIWSSSKADLWCDNCCTLQADCMAHSSRLPAGRWAAATHTLILLPVPSTMLSDVSRLLTALLRAGLTLLLRRSMLLPALPCRLYTTGAAAGGGGEGMGMAIGTGTCTIWICGAGWMVAGAGVGAGGGGLRSASSMRRSAWRISAVRWLSFLWRGGGGVCKRGGHEVGVVLPCTACLLDRACCRLLPQQVARQNGQDSPGKWVNGQMCQVMVCRMLAFLMPSLGSTAQHHSTSPLVQAPPT